MFNLSVVTAERPVIDQEVRSIIAPGSEGYLGILTDHAPLITALIPGKLSVTDQSNHETFYAISGGFLEVSHNVVTILADAIEPIEKIDVNRAREAEKRARERLARRTASDIDAERAEFALMRALNRLRLVNR
ncbi:MAG TPA: F0F1 ATP synthase subunit epsilon [candidate division Zixibacteria bacterium]|nr:F0F1 ATP synthase subunit epsilon [candidate division Zixibacteria bacterium]